MSGLAEPDSDRLSDFVPWPEWLSSGEGGKILKTMGAVEWFIRMHRDELIRSGQLILRSGPGGHFVGPKFGNVVLEILRRKSIKLTETANRQKPAAANV